MKKIAFFGGSGGLGNEVVKYLKNYNVDSIGSNVCDFRMPNDIKNYFVENEDIDIVIIFSNYNFNSFLHKYTGDLGEMELKNQIDINIHGVTSCLVNVLPQMRSRNYGRIILASSITVDRNVIGTSIYAAVKAYYENIVKTTCIENASKGITANCIQLGYMDGGLCNTLPDNFKNKILKEIPCNRFGSMNEISNTIEFIIQNEYVNGSTIKLTGGL